MVIREVKVNKVFRDDPVIDRPINFGPLKNLHLELLENKQKIKPGLPITPVIKKETVRTDPPPKPRDEQPLPSTSKSSPPRRRRKSHSPRNDEKNNPDEDDLIDALGGKDDDHERVGEEDYQEDRREYTDEIEDEQEEEEIEDNEYAGMTPDEIEEYDHKEYIWRFRILKRKYKEASIPDYNEHSDLQLMKRDYERIVRELQLEDSVETYKQYLFGGFMAMELVCTQFIGIDLGGFTALQSKMMPKYERMLIELGEKSYTSWGSSLPVELRLMGYIVLQAGIFYLAKVIADKFGETAADLFKGFMGQPSTPITAAGDNDAAVRPKKKKKKMRGPRVNMDDIRSSKNE